MKYSFTTFNTVSISKESTPILENITVSVRVNAENEVRYPLALSETSAGSLEFTDDAHGIRVKLTLEEKNGAAVLRAEADYVSGALNFRYGAHFHPEEAICISFSKVSDARRFTANWLCTEFWCRCAFANDPSGLPKEKIQGLLWERNDGRYVYALPVCDSIFKSNMRAGINGGLDLYIWSNDARNSANTVACVIDTGDDPYALIPIATEKTLKALGKKGGLRTARRYPQILEYLGWCSWDAFHMDVTHKGLTDKAKEFADKDIPVRWFIIDDMWGNVPSINRSTMHSRELKSFEADPVRFPYGLKAVITELKEGYGVDTGMWHPTTGYWNGIDPDGEIAKEHPELLVYTPNGKKVHSPELTKAFEYYNIQHSFYRDCGARFVKVDNQGFVRCHYKYMTSIGEAAQALHTAIEASVGANFDGEMINCMCMPSENFWNRPVSSVCRFSDDFQPENRKWFIKHILQCSYNSVFQGCVYYGDWDMWWSDDAQAKKNAVLRAMSGGPVYMSDELGRSVKETIMPIVLNDGRIIRLDTPAVPSPDCLMSDPETSGRVFKLTNRIGDYGVCAAFNLDKDEKTVSTTVTKADMGLEGGYVVYDWFAKKIVKPDISLKLKNYDDFRLYIYVPIKKGRAFIGLTEKYMSPKTLTQITPDVYKLAQGGKLGIYSRSPLRYIKADSKKLPVTKVGVCLYEAMVPDPENGSITVSFN